MYFHTVFTHKCNPVPEKKLKEQQSFSVKERETIPSVPSPPAAVAMGWDTLQVFML